MAEDYHEVEQKLDEAEEIPDDLMSDPVLGKMFQPPPIDADDKN